MKYTKSFECAAMNVDFILIKSEFFAHSNPSGVLGAQT